MSNTAINLAPDVPISPGLDPMEFNVLVLPDEVKEQTRGGIILPQQVKDIEQRATQRGKLVAVSPHAFTYADWPQDQKPPQVGDVVLMGRYVGMEFEGADGRKYCLCKDKDIAGVFR